MATRTIITSVLTLEDDPERTAINLTTRNATGREALAYLSKKHAAAAGGVRGSRLAVFVASTSHASNTKRTYTNTITQASLVASTDTFTFGTQTLTWVASAANENQVTIGGTSAICATNFAAKINAHSVLSTFLVATASGGIVTLEFVNPLVASIVTPGETGNGQVIASASAPTIASESAARIYDMGIY